MCWLQQLPDFWPITGSVSIFLWVQCDVPIMRITLWPSFVLQGSLSFWSKFMAYKYLAVLGASSFDIVLVYWPALSCNEVYPLIYDIWYSKLYMVSQLLCKSWYMSHVINVFLAPLLIHLYDVVCSYCSCCKMMLKTINPMTVSKYYIVAVKVNFIKYL